MNIALTVFSNYCCNALERSTQVTKKSQNATGCHCFSVNQAVKLRRHARVTVPGKKRQLLCTLIEFVPFHSFCVDLFQFSTTNCLRGKKRKVKILAENTHLWQNINVIRLSWIATSKWQTKKWSCEHVTAHLSDWWMTDTIFCSP